MTSDAFWGFHMVSGALQRATIGFKEAFYVGQRVSEALYDKFLIVSKGYRALQEVKREFAF